MQFTDLVSKADANRMLLLPQRKYRDILRKARQGVPLVMDLIGAEHNMDNVDDDDEDDAELYDAFIAQNTGNIAEISEAKARHLSRLEQSLLQYVKSIKGICECLAIADIASFYVTCTTVRRIYDANVVETRLLMHDFSKFVNGKYRLRSRQSSSAAAATRSLSCGLLSNKLLTCSQSSATLQEHDCQNFATYFGSNALQEYSISLKSMTLVFHAELSAPGIQRFLMSFTALGPTLAHLSIEGSDVDYVVVS
jgi:hypothetical protein